MGNRIKTYLTNGHILSSLGFTTAENMENLRQGCSGISLHNKDEISSVPFMGGLIDKERFQKEIKGYGVDGYTKLQKMLIYSLQQVITGSSINPADCGFILSTTKGNIDLLPDKNDEIYLTRLGKGIAAHLGIPHEPIIISTACISGVSALIAGSRLIKAGKYKHILIAGGDLLTRFVLSGFQSFKSISETICRPYDKDRDGLTLGEACGSLLMTSDHNYVSEEIPVILESGAITNDANHISGPSRTGDGLYYAISQTMQQAGIDKTNVSFVNTHGTGTLYNDEMECKAIRCSQLDDKPVHSLKSSWGHTLGASGIIETIACMEQLRSGSIPGTYGYNENGVSNPLKVSAQSQPFNGGRCIKTASGFGGCNAAISLALEPFVEPSKEASPITIHSKGTCIIKDNCILLNDTLIFEGNQNDSFAIFIRAAYKHLFIDDRKFYKMDNLCKLGYIAAYVLLKTTDYTDCSPLETGIILANKSASLDTDRKHQEVIDTLGETDASPAVFVYTLPNVVAGEICIRHKIQGENTFFISEAYDREFMKEYTRIAMQEQRIKNCITGWCELIDETYEACFEWWV